MLKLCLVRTPSPVYLKQALSGRQVTLEPSESVQFLLSREISLDSESKTTKESILITGRDLEKQRDISFQSLSYIKREILRRVPMRREIDKDLKNIAVALSYAPTTRSG